MDSLANPPSYVLALGDVVSQLETLVDVIDVEAKVRTSRSMSYKLLMLRQIIPFANITRTITSSVYHVRKTCIISVPKYNQQLAGGQRSA